MTEFLVETYQSRHAANVGAPTAEEIALATDQLTREGTRVRFLPTIFVPEEEICLYLYRANSVDAVRRAAERAGLRCERITEARSDFAEPQVTTRRKQA
jgi:hypothetical protein